MISRTLQQPLSGQISPLNDDHLYCVFVEGLTTTKDGSLVFIDGGYTWLRRFFVAFCHELREVDEDIRTWLTPHFIVLQSPEPLAQEQMAGLVAEAAARVTHCQCSFTLNPQDLLPELSGHTVCSIAPAQRQAVHELVAAKAAEVVSGRQQTSGNSDPSDGDLLFVDEQKQLVTA